MNDKIKDEYDFERMGDNCRLSSMVSQPWPVMYMRGG
jgi:hypothetical protein